MKESDVLANLRLSRPDLFDLDPKRGEDLLTVEIKRLEDLLSTYKRVRRSYSMKRRYNETEAQRLRAHATASPAVVRVVEPPKPLAPLSPPTTPLEVAIDSFFDELEKDEPKKTEFIDDYEPPEYDDEPDFSQPSST